MIHTHPTRIAFSRTEQLLELFEEAPDDGANWGKTVDVDKEGTKTTSSSSSSSSEDDEGVRPKQRKSVKVGQNFVHFLVYSRSLSLLHR